MVILILGTQGLAHAQLRQYLGLKIGAVAANETWTGFASGVHTENRWGFTVDAFADVPFFNFFSAQGEVQYTQKGTSFPQTILSPSGGQIQYRTVSPRIDYISIPLLAKFMVPLKSFTPYVLVGPRFDFLVGKAPDGLGGIIDYYDNMDYGLTVGAGVEIDSLFPFGILAEFRYNPNSYNSYDNGGETVKNRSADFLVGVRL